MKRSASQTPEGGVTSPKESSTDRRSVTEESKGEEKKFEMPPYPQGLFEWTEDQNKHWKYEGDLDHINKRVSHKLWNCWLVWVSLHNNEKLIKLVGDISDKDSDEFFLKQIIVNTIDHLGKVLSQTNITEEILKLGV